jgi:hypothetical protein
MIAQIKLKGFEKYKQEIDEKLRERKKLEIKVDYLQKQYNAQHKHLCHHGMRHVQEMLLMKGCGEVDRLVIFRGVRERRILLIEKYRRLKEMLMR